MLVYPGKLGILCPHLRGEKFGQGAAIYTGAAGKLPSDCYNGHAAQQSRLSSPQQLTVSHENA
jgi:hypothetical protein